jgi:hypothetical protein
MSCSVASSHWTEQAKLKQQVGLYSYAQRKHILRTGRFHITMQEIYTASSCRKQQVHQTIIDGRPVIYIQYNNIKLWKIIKPDFSCIYTQIRKVRFSFLLINRYKIISKRKIDITYIVWIARKVIMPLGLRQNTNDLSQVLFQFRLELYVVLASNFCYIHRYIHCA